MANEKKVALRVEFLGSSKLFREMNGLELAVKRNREAVRELNKQYKDNKITAEQYTAQQRKLRLEGEALKDTLSGVRSELRQQKKEFANQQFPVDSVIRMREEYNKLLKQIDRLSKAELKSDFGKGLVKRANELKTEILKVDGSTKNFFSNIGNYMSALNGAFGGIKTTLAGLGIGFTIREITALVQDSIRTFIDFEDKIAILGAVSGATGDKLQSLEQDAKRLGESTQFTASQVADLQTNFARAGFSTDEILNATEATLNLAAATGETLSDSSLVVADNLRAYGLAAKDSTVFTDLLVKSLNTSSLTLENYREASKELAPVINTLYKDSEQGARDAAAAIGLLADSGIKGTAATTTLSSGLLKLADDSKKYAKAAEALGIEVFNQNGEFVGLAQLIENANTALEGYTDQQKLAAVSQIVGIQSARNFITLMNSQKEVVTETGKEVLRGGEALRGYAKTLDDAGVAARTAGRTMDSVAGDAKTLGSAFEGLQLQAVGLFEDALRNGIQTLTVVLTRITQFLKLLEDMPKFLRENAGLIGGLTLAIIGLNFNLIKANASALVFAGRAALASVRSITWVGSVRALSAAFAANPVGLFITAIGILLPLLQKVYNNSELVRNAIAGIASVGIEVFTIIKEIFSQFTGGFSKLLEGDIVGGLKDIGKSFFRASPFGVAFETGGRLAKAYSKGFKENAKQEELDRVLANELERTSGFNNSAAENLGKSTGNAIVEGLNDGIENSDIKSPLDKLKKKTKKDTEEIAEFVEGSIAFMEDQIQAIEKRLNNEKLDNTTLRAELQRIVEYEEKIKSLKEETDNLKNALAAGDRSVTPLQDIGERQTPLVSSPTIGSLTGEQTTKAIEGIELRKEAAIKAAIAVGKTREEIAKKIAEIENNTELSILETKLKSKELEKEERLGIENEIALKRLEIEEETNAKIKEQREKLVESLVGTAAQFYTDLTRTLIQNELNDLQESTEEKKELLNEEYEARIANAEQSAFVQEQLMEERDKKEEQIEKEAFKRQQNIRVKEAVANAALAAVTALAKTTLPFPASLAALIPVGIATLAQIAIIKAQKLFRGGRIKGLEELVGHSAVNGINSIYDFTGFSGNISVVPNIPTQQGGDNVLAAVKVGELLVNERQQNRAESLYGSDIWKNIGIPNYNNGGFVEQLSSSKAGTAAIQQPYVFSAREVKEMIVNATIDRDNMEEFGRVVAEKVAVAVSEGIEDKNRRKEREKSLQSNIIL